MKVFWKAKNVRSLIDSFVCVYIYTNIYLVAYIRTDLYMRVNVKP